MRLPWNKSKEVQLDLLDAEPNATASSQSVAAAQQAVASSPDTAAISPAAAKHHGVENRPLLLAVSLLYEDAHNPRTEFPEESITELAEDIQQRGVLQPLVVHAADGDGLHKVHFGAKRLRAAIKAGLHEVPVVVRDLPADRYAQVAENQKRHGLTPLDLARFIRAQVDSGDSNATIARQLGMNLTAVAHHLSLLELPPVLDDALRSGRCTSPRTLHELSKLHADRPDQVHALLASEAEITRTAVSAMRAAPDAPATSEQVRATSNKLVAQANAACDRLERALGRIQPSNFYKVALPELIALRIRVEDITKRWLHGSDRQTPSQADR